MIIDVIKTGSNGNCYVIDKTLVVEAGVSSKELSKVINLNNVTGVLLSHSHKDHSKYINTFSEKAIDCYMSKETSKEVDVHPHRLKIINHKDVFSIKNYNIMSFNLKHDVENFGYLIYNTATKEKLLFATDTAYIPYNFKDVNYFLIESNYSEKILDNNVKNGILSKYLFDRIIKSHMSLENAIAFVNNQNKILNQTAILIHLSSKNSDDVYFKNEFEKKTGINAIIAKDNQKIIL